jgi:hypothetical protein
MFFLTSNSPGTLVIDLSWAPSVLALLGIASILATGIAFWVRHEVKKHFAEIKGEFKPNGGGSLKDQVTRLEKGHEQLEDRLDRIDEKVDTIVNFILAVDEE